MGDDSGNTWFVVDLINNNLKNGMVFDEKLELDKQPWVDQIIIYKEDQMD